MAAPSPGPSASGDADPSSGGAGPAWRRLAPELALLAFVMAAFAATSRIDLSLSSSLETFTGPRAYPRLLLAVMAALLVALLASNLLSGVPAGRSRRCGTRLYGVRRGDGGRCR